MTFAEAAEKLISVKESTERRASTVRGLRYVLVNMLGEAFGPLEVSKIKPNHVEAWMEAMKKHGLSASSRRLYLVRLKQLFNYLVLRGDLDRNPALSVGMPKIDKAPPKFLSPKEYKAIYDVADEYMKDVLDFMVVTGCRIGELTSVTYQNLNENGLLFDDQQKNREWYYLPVNRAFLEHFTGKITDEKRKDRLFPTFRQAIAEKLNSLAELAGLAGRGITPHCFRHTTATWLVRSGVDIYKVKAFLRHGSVVVTERYAHLPNGNWEEEVKLIPERTRLFQPLFRFSGNSVDMGGQNDVS